MTQQHDVIQNRLEELSAVQNALMKCRDRDSVIKEALSQVRNRLKARVACLFLFDKDGFIRRFGIDGVDKDGMPIDNNWFPDERYRPRESFSAAVIPPSGEDSGYGKPIWSNDLSNWDLNPETSNPYREKLGSLLCAISVPLNGKNRTFGALEVLNKLSSNDDTFSSDDIFWLMGIGAIVANVISSCRQAEEADFFKEISRIIIDPPILSGSAGSNESSIYQFIAELLTRDLFPYKACVIRKSEGDLLEVIATSAPGSQGDRDNSSRKPEGVIGEVFNTGEPKFVVDISSSVHEYCNIKWIEENGLKSHGCYPLSIDGKCVGTISVFTGYNYYFHEDDRSLLERISLLVASFIRKTDLEIELKETSNNLRRETDKLVRAAYSVGTNTYIQEIAHQYKNEVTRFKNMLINLRGLLGRDYHSKPKLLIDDEIEYLTARFDELGIGFDMDSFEYVDINQEIRRVVKLVSLDLEALGISFIQDYDDEIPMVEANSVKIASIIYNLLINAVVAINRVKNIKHFGEIEIRTFKNIKNRSNRSEPTVSITIQDNGIGIDRNMQPLIFERGFSTTKNMGGTGIGLFVAKEILFAYGGTIEIVSSIVGQGTTFQIDLPMR
jgi:signal transduction histidine kinase